MTILQSGNSRHQNLELWGGSFFLDKLNALLVVLGLEITLSCVLVQCDNLYTVLDVSGWQGVTG